MGTITDKLDRLALTKNDIKLAIRHMGQNILDTDTFASYANEIYKIGQEYPIIGQQTITDFTNAKVFYSNNTSPNITYTLAHWIPEMPDTIEDFVTDNGFIIKKITGLGNLVYDFNADLNVSSCTNFYISLFSTSPHNFKLRFYSWASNPQEKSFLLSDFINPVDKCWNNVIIPLSLFSPMDISKINLLVLDSGNSDKTIKYYINDMYFK